MYGKKVKVTIKRPRAEEAEEVEMPIVCALEVLLIDEISMISGEFFHWMDHFFRKLRAQKYTGKAKNCDSTKPFGGMQIIVCGDFFQLPPVRNDDEFKALVEGDGVGEVYFNRRGAGYDQDDDRGSGADGESESESESESEAEAEAQGTPHKNRVCLRRKGHAAEIFLNRGFAFQSKARPSHIPPWCTRCMPAGIEWCRCHRAVCMARSR